MKVGKVIGKVTLSQSLPALKGARWLIVNPQGCDEMARFEEESFAMSSEASLIVFDNLGGGLGDAIGFVEGREATAPFENPPPIDAICAALIDSIFYKPK